MRKIVWAVLFFVVTLNAPAFAQDGLRVSAVVVGSGENPITSGLAGTIQLKDEHGLYAEVTVQEEQAWFMTGKDFNMGSVRASLYGSVGFLQGSPWVGPYVSLTLPITKMGKQEISIGYLTWPGFFPGSEPRSFRVQNDGVENPEKFNIGWFDIGSLNVGPVSLFMSHLNYLDTPGNWLPGASIAKKLRKDFEVNASVMWNSNDERPMYFIGATWRPEKK